MYPSYISFFCTTLIALLVTPQLAQANSYVDDVRREETSFNNIDNAAAAYKIIATGDSHTCAITVSSGVQCWGYNYYGQVGDGSQINRLSPVDVPKLSSGVASLALGGYHSCALTLAGGVKCWGNNQVGQLGDGSVTTSLTPVDVVGLSTGVKSVFAGFGHTCVVLLAGTVKCWGSNGGGQLGVIGDSQNVPISIPNLSGIVSISAGYSHTCALNTAGGVQCWGRNTYGQLGNGIFSDDASTPVTVAGLTSGVASITTGALHSCALLKAGSAVCWGYNLGRQLGDGNTNNLSTPTSVLDLSDGLAEIAAGDAFTCVRTTSGKALCWGANYIKQLGDDTYFDHARPTPVTVFSGKASQIATGRSHACVILEDGSYKCWGNNLDGQWGIGIIDTTPPSAPAPKRWRSYMPMLFQQ